MHQRPTLISTQRVWACMAMVLLLQVMTSDGLSWWLRKPHHKKSASKRKGEEDLCMGVYDKSMFAHLDRICEDCYNLFREPQLIPWCRHDCFANEDFKACMDSLMITDHAEVEKIKTYIKQLRGADPGV